MAAEDLVRAAAPFSGDLEKRYRRAVARLLRDGLPADDDLGGGRSAFATVTQPPMPRPSISH